MDSSPRETAKAEYVGHTDVVNSGRWRVQSRPSVFGEGGFRACWRMLTRLVKGENLHLRFLARFYVLRKVNSAVRRWFERLLPGARGRLTPFQGDTLFGSVSIDETARTLRQEGFVPNLFLPAALHEEIKAFGEHNPCIRWGFNDPPEERFHIHEARTGELPDGRLVGVADVEGASSCSGIERVARDPIVLGLYRAYFGFWPTRVVTRLFWSLRLDAAHPARAFLPNRGGKFHYDADSMSQLYVFFYLTDVNRASGPHALIPSSHRRKNLLLEMGDRYFSDADILRFYGEGSELVVEGAAGYGFVEDPACIHKYYIPSERERLILQLRYY